MNIYLQKKKQKLMICYFQRQYPMINTNRKATVRFTSSCGFLRSAFQPSSLLKPTPITLLTSCGKYNLDTHNPQDNKKRKFFFFLMVTCIFISNTCVLKYRDKDPVHLQLILKETGTEEVISGLILLACSRVLSSPPVAFT